MIFSPFSNFRRLPFALTRREHRGVSKLVKPYNQRQTGTTHRITQTSTVYLFSTSTMAAPKTIEESDVGIFCYISQLPGFRGILKQRYADFIVNEVDTDGNVVHLTCLEPRPLIVEETKEGEVKVPDEKMSESKSYESEIELFRLLAGDTDAEKLKDFISQVNSGTESGESVSHIVLSPNSDKVHRTAVHNFFKQNFNFLVTDTTDGPDALSKCVRVRLNSGGNNNNGRNSRKRKGRDDKPFDSRGSSNWPEHVGKFLRFHLYKENKDTQDALGIIGKMLGIQPRSFGFAGTKDKRAVSTQRVTVFKQHASRLASLNDRLIGIKVGDFCHVKEELLLGQLFGNRFTITLRGVIADSEDSIKASADSLGRHGFINYFGLQRFGSGSVPTHLIGAALLRGEWKNAVNLILDPREGEREVIRKMREYYKENDDIEGTLRQLPRHLVAERAILQCLKKCPGNYLQALKAIPRTLRMMYVHSYQSYLWNHAASERVQKYGTDRVVLGDLVYCKGDDPNKESITVNSDCGDDNCGDSYDCSHLDETPGIELPERKNILVKAITEDDISAGKYNIDDVMLPMPGSRVTFPTNDIAKIYHDMAKKDAINLTESVHGVKEFSITSVTGSYRRVFQKPLDFKWELLAYADSNKALAETDLDKICKTRPINMIKQEEPNSEENKSISECSKEPASSQNDISPSTENKEVEGEREVGSEQVEPLSGSNSQEAHIALKLSFTLPASGYATMAIRELLKTSTAVAYHKTLNH